MEFYLILILFRDDMHLEIMQSFTSIVNCSFVNSAIQPRAEEHVICCIYCAIRRTETNIKVVNVQ